MENHVKIWLRRLSIGSGIALSLLLCLTMVALAALGSVTDLVGVATDTTITLTWSPATDSTHTIIRYSTTTYPTTVGGGTSSYNGTGYYVTMTSLTAGTTYYFSAWGFDGTAYSATELNYQITTQPAVSSNTSIPFSQPSIPTETTQDPDTSGWSIYPLDEIISWFADPSVTHGGLGMPVNNVVMFIAGVAVTSVSILTYTKWRSFWTSWTIAIILCSFLVSIQVMQGLVIGFLLLAGLGVWTIEKTTQ